MLDETQQTALSHGAVRGITRTCDNAVAAGYGRGEVLVAIMTAWFGVAAEEFGEAGAVYLLTKAVEALAPERPDRVH